MIDRDKPIENQEISKKAFPAVTVGEQRIDPAKNSGYVINQAELGIKFQGDWMDLAASLESEIETKGAC